MLPVCLILFIFLFVLLSQKQLKSNTIHFRDSNRLEFQIYNARNWHHRTLTPFKMYFSNFRWTALILSNGFKICAKNAFFIPVIIIAVQGNSTVLAWWVERSYLLFQMYEARDGTLDKKLLEACSIWFSTFWIYECSSGADGRIHALVSFQRKCGVYETAPWWAALDKIHRFYSVAYT